MTILQVGANETYKTISAAVTASKSGDTIDVAAGTYTNDFSTISHNLTIQGVGGAVNLVATVAPPNGKAIIDEGGSGISVTISGLSFSGAAVPDGNGAGIRYEGGTLTLNGDSFTGNQEGLLAAADPAGVITISGSTFNGNGTGTGYTHNIYVNNIASLTVQNSTIENAVGGHDIKSRAASTTITGNTITDTQGTASYEIDLPNGGAATISGNVIEKGTKATNPTAISYGEEGVTNSGSLSVTNNLIVNDFTGHTTTAVTNTSGTAATVSGNTFYGWTALTSGAATTSNNVVVSSEPALTVPKVSTPVSTPVTPVVPVVAAPITLGSGPDQIVLQVSEDAWQGDAQFTVSVDGVQLGGTQTATASHAAGQSQTVTLDGTFGITQHTVAVSFLNDAYGGSSTTDRNLYVGSVTDGATSAAGASLLSNGTVSFLVGTAASTAVTVGSGPNKAAVFVSEDAWQGNAQFTVTVDGQQVGGVQTATASHAAGQTQEFDFLGSFAVGVHQVGVTFLNDAYGGSASTDRNLYVDKTGSVSVHGALFSNGTQSFATTIIPVG